MLKAHTRDGAPDRLRDAAVARRGAAMSRLVAFAVLLLALGGAQAQPVLGGRVLNELTGFGIAGIDLDVFDTNGQPVTLSRAVSGANGVFAITLPAAGTYVIRADPSIADGFVDQYYAGASLRSAATPLVVGPADTLTNVDFHLSPGHLIQGRVTSGATGLADIDLDLFAATGEFLSGCPGKTGADGAFTVGMVPPGVYYLRADPDPTLGQVQVDAFYGGAFELRDAAAIVVTNRDATGLLVDLIPGGLISGQVLDAATGDGMGGIDLDVFDTNGVRVAQGTATAADGTYRLGSMPAGAYVLRADPSRALGYCRTYYPDQALRSGATAIEVVAGDTTSNINIRLPRGGTITGTVTDGTTAAALSGIDLDVFDDQGRLLDLSAKTDARGAYVLGPLRAGRHVVRADPGHTRGYLTQYFQASPNLAAATGVAVTPGIATTHVDFALAGAGWIEGMVREGSQATPLGGMDLDVFDAVTGDHLTLSATTDAAGAFVLGPLAPGSYSVRCDPRIEQGFAVEYYRDRLNRALSDLLVVQAGQATAGVEFVLDPGNGIRGTVTAQGTGNALAGIDVDVFTADTLIRLDQSAKTDLLGQFTVGPLPLGRYLVRADPGVGHPFARTYFGGGSTPTNATVVTLGAGPVVEGVNIALSPASAAAVALTVLLEVPGILRLQFTAEPAFAYEVLTAETLDQPAWVVATPPISGRTGVVSVDLPIGTGNRFVRVRTQGLTAPAGSVP